MSSLSHCLLVSIYLSLPSDSVSLSLALCPWSSVARTVVVHGRILVDLAFSNLISSQPLEEKNILFANSPRSLFASLFFSSEVQGHEMRDPSRWSLKICGPAGQSWGPDELQIQLVRR